MNRRTARSAKQSSQKQKVGPQVQGVEQMEVIDIYNIKMNPQVPDPVHAIPQNLEPDMLQQVYAVLPPVVRLNLTGVGNVSYDIIQMFNFPDYMHNLTEHQLRQIITEVRNEREDYYRNYFHQPNTFRDFLLSGPESTVYHWNVLYFLLIYTRVIDELIHELHVRFNVNDGVHQVVNEGIRLCDRLNAINETMDDERSFRYQLLIVMMEGIWNHFVQRQQYYTERNLPDIPFVDFYPNEEMDIENDPNPDPLQLNPILPPNSSQYIFTAPRVRPLIAKIFMGPQPRFFLPVNPPLIDPNLPPPLPVEGDLEFGVDNKHQYYPHFALLEEWSQFPLLSKCYMATALKTIERLIDPRQAYFERYFPNGGDLDEYFTTGNNPTHADHFWPLYFLLIFTRLIDEVLCRIAQLRHSLPKQTEIARQASIGERNQNAILGYRLVERLIPIINGWDEGMQEQNRVVIKFVTDMRQHFVYRGHSFRIAIP